MKDELVSSVAGLVGLSDELIHAENTDLFYELSHYLNELINTDFNRLVSILYRIDVSEAKVRAALASAPNGSSAGEIVAGLMIAREREKRVWRRKYKDGEL